jgi:DNA repair protein RecN (Recombination protein N)
MLKRLHIQNYALIDHLEIEFYEGLNIITGETGAGKSILLGALGLILGQRAETNVLKDKQKSCVVEGMFDISNYNLQQLFSENDLDYFDITLIRRQITPTGKSRAFVNDVPVNLPVLKEMVGRIIDIHSQHENLLLSESTFQLKVIDSFSGSTEFVARYRNTFQRFKKINSELIVLKENAAKAKSDLDYLQFQLNQLNDAKLKDGEQQELEQLHQQLTHAEDIKSSLGAAFVNLNGDTSSVLVLLKDVEQHLRKISSYFPASDELNSRVESCRIELKDISHAIDIQSNKIELDPEQLSAVNSRLDLLFSLQQKHRVESVEELILIRKNIEEQVDEIVNFDTIIASKSNEMKEIESELRQKADEINALRRKSSPMLEKSIVEMLHHLGMPYASFSVDFKKYSDFQSTGIDDITFLFSANKQIPLQELSKVASGGELSRLMLSLKSLLITSIDLPTIIFDEIDTGVSGEVADRVGNIINGMAKKMQVINITHLPQIACKGKYHFLVYKDNQFETSKTLIKLLDNEERVVEIAKLLSGEKLSDAALINAKHLLGIA